MKNCCLALVVLLCSARLCSAQDETILARSFVVEAKDGMREQFEKAAQEHIQWLGEHGETWEWSTYQVIVGDNVDSYVIVSGGHSWSDFDKNIQFRLEARRHWQETVKPYIEVVESRVYRLQTSLSRLEAVPEKVQFLMVTSFNLKPLSAQAFMKRFASVTEAVRAQSDAPPVLAMSLVSGGKPHVNFVHLLANWEAAGRKESAVQSALASLGDEAEEVTRDLRDLTESVGTAILVSRPKLSYKPSE